MISKPHLFGQRLAALRHDRGWSQAELARRLHTSRGMISYYESCAKNPTVEFVEKVAKIFAVTTDDLIGNNHNVQDIRQKKRGPSSRLEQLMEKLVKLSKTKQQIVIKVLEGFLK